MQDPPPEKEDTMKVSEVMTRNPASVTAETPVREVARLMVEHDCGAIPVVDGQGRSIGILTDRDITIRAVAADKNPHDLLARDLMTAPVIGVREDLELDDLLDLLEDHQIRRVVVVDGAGKTIGIVATADVAEFASQRKTGELLQKVSEPPGDQPGGAGVRAR